MTKSYLSKIFQRNPIYMVAKSPSPISTPGCTFPFLPRIDFESHRLLLQCDKQFKDKGVKQGYGCTLTRVFSGFLSPQSNLTCLNLLLHSLCLVRKERTLYIYATETRGCMGSTADLRVHSPDPTFPRICYAVLRGPWSWPNLSNSRSGYS